jgi:SAM-dependent methyltransferase
MDDRNNTYLNDPESGAEMARLLDQDRTLTAHMGGLFPPDLHDDASLESIHDVLDIACGPGGWVQEVAFTYPHMKVVGIDISQAMIEYARQQAIVQDLDNAHFEVMDATGPLDFADGTFDYVNIRTISGFMLRSNWPSLIEECKRVLRPGGVLCLTETDHWGTTNAAAFAELMDLSYKAIALAGHSFDPSGRTFGITPLMERLFARTGFQDIRSKAHAVNFSASSAAHESMYKNFRSFFKLVQPFVLKARKAFPEASIPGQEELDRLYEQAMGQEMIGDDFVGLFYLLTVWGTRP